MDDSRAMHAFQKSTAGFYSEDLIAPGEVAVVFADSPVGLRGEKLVVVDEIAPHFTFVGATVDGEEQFRGRRIGWRGLLDRLLGRQYPEIPCTRFGIRVYGNGFRWSLAKKEIALSVRNDSVEPRRFVANLFGMRKVET